MKVEKLEDRTPIPEGISLKYEGGNVTVTGPKGEVTKKLFYPGLSIEAVEGELVLAYNNATKREKKIIFTYTAHIMNMFNGVTRGHKYELKICSGHFPMNISVSGDTFTVKNFIGEKVPRVLKLKTGVNVKIDGNMILVESINKELASQTAADIETLTRRRGFDLRIFQDGIYIVNKDGKSMGK